MQAKTSVRNEGSITKVFIPMKNLPFIRRQHGLLVMQTTYYKSGRGKTKYFALLQEEGLKCLEHVNLYQGKNRGLQS